MTFRTNGKRFAWAATALLVLTAAPGNRATAQSSGISVVAVPWQGDPAQPHQVFSGGSLVLQAVAANLNNFTSLCISTAVPPTWRTGKTLGNGSPEILNASKPNVWDLEVTTTYTGSVGQPFTATITVTLCDGTVLTDTMEIVIAPNTRETKVNMAIDKGLWNLHKQMQRRSDDGKLSALWASSYQSFWEAATASAVQAYEINGHSQDGNRSENPYVEDVARGLRHLLSSTSLKRIAIGLQNGSDNPDGNGNTFALALNKNNNADHDPYQLGQVIDAIVASRTPNKVAEVGQAGNVLGRPYKDIVQDMLDAYSWGMNDGVGGWHYVWNSGSNDTSASHWWGIGVMAARIWSLDAPQWVKTRQINVGIPLMQRNAQPAGCWFGYTGNTGYAWDAGLNTTPAGLILMNADGIPATDSRFRCSEGYIQANFNTTLGNFYAMYQTTKAMRTAVADHDNNPATPPVVVPKTTLNRYDAGGNVVGSTDWYAGYADFLINNQNTYGDGRFHPTVGTVSNYLRGPLGTAWGVIILSPALFEKAPTAICKADSIVCSAGATCGATEVDAYSTANFDGSLSTAGDNPISTYSWNFQDGSALSPVITTTHKFNSIGTYAVKLTVTDTKGNASSATCPVTVTDTALPPIASAGPVGGYELCLGSTPAGTLILTADASTGRGANIVSYEWDVSAPIDFSPVNATGVTTDQTAFFTAKPAGVYNVGVRIKDDSQSQFVSTAFSTVRVRAAGDPACNRPPIAVDDIAATFSGTPVTIVVLANDTDPDAGQTLTVSALSGVSDGTAVINADKTVTFTPALGFAGTATFTYEIKDPAGAISAALVRITVTKRDATVTAGSGTKVYGEADPTLTPSSTGFLAGDNIAVTQTARDPGNDAGTYGTHATAAGANLANYNVTHEDGTLTITKAASVSTATGGTFTYDGTAHDGACAVAGVNGEVLTGAITYSSGGAPIEAGSHTVTCAFDGNGNYTASTNDATITINKAVATVTAGGGTKIYGSSDPAIGASSTGFLAADGITTSATRAAGENVGDYATTATAAGTALGNYDVSYVAGTFSITKKSATVTAGGGTKIYGSSDPAITASSTGFEAADGITTSATRAAGENVGDYATTATAAGTALGNYDVSYVAGTFSITKAALWITADDQAKHYGVASAPLTVSYTGFVFGETPAALGGTLSVATTRTQFSAVGTYPIVASGSTASNYAITFVAGTFTVTNIAPVCTAGTPSVSMLWPPNHKYQPVTFNGATDGDGDDLTISVVSIFQDEAVGSGGSGNTGPDGAGVGTTTAQVRAERVGNPKTPGNGRVYHITFSATDAAGGSCTKTVKVGVPHDQGGRSTPIDGGALYDSTIAVPKK